LAIHRDYCAVVQPTTQHNNTGKREADQTGQVFSTINHRTQINWDKLHSTRMVDIDTETLSLCLG